MSRKINFDPIITFVIAALWLSGFNTYAQNAYTGPGISPTFTAARGGCGPNGFQVTASATFPLNTGLINLSVPLKAHACFP